jgi:hypothetical protein
MFNSAFAAFVTLTYLATVFFALVLYSAGSLRRLAYRRYVAQHRNKAALYSNLSHAKLLSLFQNQSDPNNSIFQDLYDVYIVARGESLLIWKRFFLSKAQKNRDELEELASWIAIKSNDLIDTEKQRVKAELEKSTRRSSSVRFRIYAEPVVQYCKDYIIDIEALLTAIHRDYRIREADHDARLRKAVGRGATSNEIEVGAPADSNSTPIVQSGAVVV